MRRIFCIFLFVLIAVPAPVAAFCADEPPNKTETSAWHAEKARYRLTVELDTPDAWMFLDDRVLCLPDGMETGVEIYDEEGKK